MEARPLIHPVDQFTAARIAEVLGRRRENVLAQLSEREADGRSLVRGQVTRTYLVSSLPDSLRQALEELALRRGYGCPEQLLARECARWQPSVSIGEIHAEEVTRAQKRAVALASWARAYSDGSRPTTEVLEAAVVSHRQGLGYVVSGETLDNLLRRVLQRDGGRGEFDRWELYLPEAPKRRKSVTAPKDDDFAQIEAYLGRIQSALPSLEDRTWVWTAMCDNLQILLENGENPRAARRRLIKYVFARAPWLSASRASLAKCFDDKWRRYCAGERMLTDRRPSNSGNRKPLPLTEEDKKKLIAVSMGGGLSQAWRQLHGEARLSEGIVQHYATNTASKSYVPQRIRDLITPKVEMLQDIHHGPRQAKLGGAYITRDWSKVLPGDWYQGDDCTLPAYYWEYGPEGTPRAIRGQFLAMIDVRSLRVLAFALHSENHYNARVIRGLILKTHDTYGLPRRGFYFERGIWKSSRIVTGGPRSDEVTIGDTEAGLRDLGVEFRHAQLPRGKVIERVLGLIQARLEHEPGYCGRDEKTEKFERLQHKLQLARAGKLEFPSFLLHRDLWAERLADICDSYNGDRQDGSLLQGNTPRELWEGKFHSGTPLVRLEEYQRHLLANHRRPIQVTKNGICVQLGKDRKWFRSSETGHLIGHTVQVYFNPEDLSSIWLRTPDDGRVIVVPCAPTPAAMDATKEELSAAMVSCAAHNRAAITLYKEVASHFPENGKSHFRANLVAPEVAEEGREIVDRQAEIRSRQVDQTEQRKQLAKYNRRFGHQPGSDSVAPERKLAALKLLEEANRDANP